MSRKRRNRRSKRGRAKNESGPRLTNGVRPYVHWTKSFDTKTFSGSRVKFNLLRDNAEAERVIFRGRRD